MSISFLWATPHYPEGWERTKRGKGCDAQVKPNNMSKVLGSAIVLVSVLGQLLSCSRTPPNTVPTLSTSEAQ